MRLDPNIALSARPSDLSGLGQSFQEGQRTAQNQRLVEQQLQQGQQNLQQQELLNREQLLGAMNDREQRRLQSSVLAAAQITPLLQQGNVEGVRSILNNRKMLIEQAKQIDPSIDSTETDEALQLLDTNPQELLNLTSQLVQTGQQFGMLGTPAQDPGFTLKPGEQRFDAQGNLIAGTEAESKAPAGFRFTETGNLEAIPGGPADVRKEKAPTGFRFRDDGSLEVIPGGPEDVKGKEALDTQKRKIESQKSSVRNVLSSIKDIKDIFKDNIDLGITGFGSGLASFFRGTDASNVESLTDTIKASLSFDKLQEMRDLSPTGGALGQVSERELDLLGASVASLSPRQSPVQFQDNLERVEKHYQRWLKTVPGLEEGKGDVDKVVNFEDLED